jgi:predicted lipoprotein with Yx(FWY)xxD motif
MVMVATRLRRTSRAARSVAVAAVVTSFGLAACGSSGAGSQHFSGPVYEVETAQVSGLGSVLVDGQGFTLYLYEPDAQSGHSKCSGPCAVEWSPLTLPTGVKFPVSGPGVDASLLSTTHRSDGTVQVMYNNWPLYTWAEDTAPGQATGEGLDNLGGVWYALDASGSAVERPPA